MFGFLTPQAKDDTDPLVSARAVSAWLRHLPTQDVIARQRHVMRVFDGMRQSSRPLDLNRVTAIQFLDTALGADRRQLIKQYVENIDRLGARADRCWQAGAGAEPGLRSMPDGLERRVAENANPWKPVSRTSSRGCSPPRH
jgi:hypothetical protein